MVQLAFAASAATASRTNYQNNCSVIRIGITILILVQCCYFGDSFEEILIRQARHQSLFLVLPVDLFPIDEGLDVGVLRLVALQDRLGGGEDLVVHLPGPAGSLPSVFSTFDLVFTSSVQLLEAGPITVRSPYNLDQP